MKPVLCIALFALLAGCATPQHEYDPNYPHPESDGAAYCPQACEQARKLDCEFGKDTPNGVRCEDVCRKHTPPKPTGIRPKCMTSAHTCDDLDACTY